MSRPIGRAWLWYLLDENGRGAPTLYRGNRVYDPATGRFTQEDPIGLAGGLNLYGYANGDPVNFSDPFGLKPCPDRITGLRKRVSTIRNRIEDYKKAAERGLNDADHRTKIEDEVRGFNNDLDAYHRDGCDDDDDDFRRLKRQGTTLERVTLPLAVMRYGPRRRSDRAPILDIIEGLDRLIEGLSKPIFPPLPPPPLIWILPPLVPPES